MTSTTEEKIKRAEIYSTSTLIPKIYQNNLGNCFFALEWEEALNIPVIQIMQNMFPMPVKEKNQFGKYEVKEIKLVITTSLALSLALKSGFLKSGTTVTYERTEENNNKKIKASFELQNGRFISYTMDLAQAKQAGWAEKTDKTGGKYTPNHWRDMPWTMLEYKAVTFLIRTHLPHVLVGCHTKEEMEDIQNIEYVESLSNKNIETETKTPIIETLQDIQTIEHVEPLSNKNIEAKRKIPVTETLQDGENINLVTQLQTLIQEYNIPDQTIKTWCDKAQVDDISKFSKDVLEKCILHFNKKYNSKPVEINSNKVEEQVAIN